MRIGQVCRIGSDMMQFRIARLQIHPHMPISSGLGLGVRVGQGLHTIAGRVSFHA